MQAIGLAAGLVLCAAASGCGGSSDIDYGASGASGSGGTGAGGSSAGGNGTGGVVGGGGSSGAGTGGGGVAGAAGAGFWPSAYNASALPNPANGEHNSGKDCLGCHNPNGPANEELWLFGGTVFKADKTTPAPHVQVGVNDGTQTYTAYTGTNGNFWYAGAGATLDWSKVEIKIRNANGELQMSSAPTGGSCNSCHTGPMVIFEP